MLKHLAILVVILVTSCTEELDIDVNATDPQIIVEANLDNQRPISIKLSESVNFDDDNTFPKVKNAVITLSDNVGKSEVLTEVSPGYYTGATIVGISENTYFLSIIVNGKELNSNCSIPIQVPFDSLIVNKTTGNTGGGPGSVGGTSYEIIVKYTDPANRSNYYRFVEYINDEYINAYIFDDRLSNGLENSSSLRSNNRRYKSGDVVKIEMQCISKEVHEYYKSFGNLFGGPANSSTPANPYTNVLGTKLGYFSSHTLQSKEYIIP